MFCVPRQLRNFKIIRHFLQTGQTIWCLLAKFENFGKLVSSVQGGKIVWCLLSTVEKLPGVFCPRWQKGVVSFVHPGKKCLVSFWSGVFCLAPTFYTETSLIRSVLKLSHRHVQNASYYSSESFITTQTRLSKTKQFLCTKVIVSPPLNPVFF